MSTRASKKRAAPLIPEGEEDLHCVGAGCCITLAGQPYAELISGRFASSPSECPHTLCFACFSAAQGKRSADIKIACPCRSCSYSSRKWRVHPFIATGRPARPSPSDHAIRVPATEEDRRRHPVLFYQHQPDAYREKYSMLSFCTRDPADVNVTRSYSSSLRHDEQNQEVDLWDLSSLGAIGRGLHPCLRPPDDHIIFSRATDAFAGNQSVKACEALDSTPMRHLYHSIATGEPFLSAEDRGAVCAYEQKQYNATFVSADLSRTAKGGGPRGSKLKDNLSNHLNTSNANKHMKSLLSFLGLSRSKTYLSFSQDRAVKEKIKSGWDPKGRGFGIIVGAYDNINIGFRKRMGYSIMATSCLASRHNISSR